MSKKYISSLSTTKNTFYIDKQNNFTQDKLKWNELHITQLYLPASELNLNDVYLKLLIPDFDTNKISYNDNKSSVDHCGDNYTLVIFDLQKKYKYYGDVTAHIKKNRNVSNFNVKDHENIEVKYTLELISKKDNTKHNIDNVLIEFYFK